MDLKMAGVIIVGFTRVGIKMEGILRQMGLGNIKEEKEWKGFRG